MATKSNIFELSEHTIYKQDNRHKTPHQIPNPYLIFFLQMECLFVPTECFRKDEFLNLLLILMAYDYLCVNALKMHRFWKLTLMTLHNWHFLTLLSFFLFCCWAIREKSSSSNPDGNRFFHERLIKKRSATTQLLYLLPVRYSHRIYSVRLWNESWFSPMTTSTQMPPILLQTGASSALGTNSWEIGDLP